MDWTGTGNENKRRDPLFDVVKALMMLWVVWGHLGLYGIVDGGSSRWMANAKIGVNMPIFFVVGGYLAHSALQKGSWPQIIARIVGFLWPVAAFGVLFSFVDFAIRGEAEWIRIPAFFFRWLKNGGHWFLRSFAAIYLLSAIVFHLGRTRRLRWIGFGLLYAVLPFVPFRSVLRWIGGEPTIHMLPYFVFGLMVLRNREWWKSDGLAVLCGVIFLTIVFLEGDSSGNGMNFWRVSVHWRTIFATVRDSACFFARTAVGVSGAVFVLWFVDRLLQVASRLTVLAPLGTTTLGVYVAHWWPMAVLGRSGSSFLPLPEWTHWPAAAAVFVICHLAVTEIKRVSFLRFFFFGDERRLMSVLERLSSKRTTSTITERIE